MFLKDSLLLLSKRVCRLVVENNNVVHVFAELTRTGEVNPPIVAIVNVYEGANAMKAFRTGVRARTPAGQPDWSPALQKLEQVFGTATLKSLQKVRVL